MILHLFHENSQFPLEFDCFPLCSLSLEFSSVSCNSPRNNVLCRVLANAHKIDLYNLPDMMHLPSLWSFRAQIRIARTFNEFIQPRCVLLSRWLSATESISGWALALVDIYLAWSNSQTSCKQTDYKQSKLVILKIQKKMQTCDTSESRKTV